MISMSDIKWDSYIDIPNVKLGLHLYKYAIILIIILIIIYVILNIFTIEIMLILIIPLIVFFYAYQFRKDYCKRTYYRPMEMALKDAKNICENMFVDLGINYTKKKSIAGFYKLPEYNINIEIIQNKLLITNYEYINMEKAIRIMNEIDKRIN
jgi:hypothetical protein